MLNLPTPILTVLSSFSPLFSRSTYLKLVLMFAGFMLCRGCRTITNCLRCIGLSKEKKYTTFYDVFRRANWSSFKASKILLFLIDREWISGDDLHVVVDTSLERRKGFRIYGIGMHRDAVRSTKEKKAFSTGHNWLIACVLIRFPGTNSYWSLPFISILLKPEKPLKSSRNTKDLNIKRRHKKVTKYTAQLIHVLRRWLGSNRNIILSGDSAFCCREICRACIKRNITFCSRYRLDASLFAPPPPPNGGRGRRRIVGNRLPNLSQVASDPNTCWVKYSVSWYGGEIRSMELATGVALWYHNSTRNPVPIRWVLSRNPENLDEIIPILCTNQDYCPVQIVECFVKRWSIETTFQEVRSHLGYESIHTWADKGIERVSPTIMASYSIVCLVAAKAMREKNEKIEPQKTIWYDKTHVTFSDVYNYVKSLIINENIFPQTNRNRRLRKNVIYEMLYWAIAA